MRTRLYRNLKLFAMLVMVPPLPLSIRGKTAYPCSEFRHTQSSYPLSSGNSKLLSFNFGSHLSDKKTSNKKHQRKTSKWHHVLHLMFIYSSIGHCHPRCFHHGHGAMAPWRHGHPPVASPSEAPKAEAAPPQRRRRSAPPGSRWLSTAGRTWIDLRWEW